MNEKKDVVIAVAVTVCLLSAMFAFRAYGGWPYDPWWDINDDGKIDIQDLARVSGAFGTWGQNITKAGLLYDSGWLNITDKAGQNITITHDLNIVDWNNPNITVEITGRTEPNSGLLRFLGLTQHQGWAKTYGGTGIDEAHSVIQTSDGGYALAGTTYSFGTGNGDFWLVKTDASGNMQWNKTYDKITDDSVFSVIQTTDGGYALAGAAGTTGDAGFNTNSWLIKTDAAGNAQWNRTWGGPVADGTLSAIQTSDGGYALAGWTYSYSVGEDDFWLIKTDGSGNMQWNKTYGGIGYEAASSIVQTGDGGYALAGYTSSYGTNPGWYPNFWLVKTDTNGNLQWNETYGGADYEWYPSVVQTTDGGYALAGSTISFGAGFYDFWLVKTDAGGSQLWNKTYGGTNSDSGDALQHPILQTSDGGYALAGYTYSSGAGSADFWLVKTDAGGNMQWNKTYGGTGDDLAYSAIQTSDGGYVIAGVTKSFGAGNGNFWLVKTDAEGNIRQSGMAWTDVAVNTITLYREFADPHWNYVRVRIWKIHNP